MKGVIYARYSTDSQREESIEGQLRECKEYAERNGITVLATYIDRALSAKTDNRPEFQRMIKDSNKQLFDVVLVWKLDRFARNRYDSAHYKALLRKNGARVVSAKENISEGPEGIILESMLEGYAEYYSAELAEKIHRGQKENALKGKNNGGNIPLGYILGADQRLEVDPITAPIVRDIFTRYDNGATIASIVEALNQAGLKTKLNKPFSKSGMHVVLKNRKYIGEYRYGDVVIPDGVPALVPKELFECVQQRMEKNKRAPARMKAYEEYLLTTKLFCGNCGRFMVGESGTSRTGKVHYYYKCVGVRRKEGCKKKSVKKQWVEDLVIAVTVNKVLQDEDINRIADDLVKLQGQEDSLIPTLRRQLAEADNGIENMLNAIQQGILTTATKQRLSDLEARKEELETSILQAELQLPVYTKEQMVQWIGQFKNGDFNCVKHRRKMIDVFLNSAYLYEDRIVLVYNYCDSVETIYFKDIEAVLGSDFVGVSPPIKKTLLVSAFFIGTTV